MAGWPAASDDPGVTAPGDEQSIRAAALRWLQEVSLGGTLPVTREQLSDDFFFRGDRFPLIDRGRGIRKPIGWRSALSITTAYPKSGRPRPYDDDEGDDGLQPYKLRADGRGSAENQSLRTAVAERIPLAWLYGVAPGVFNVISPVWLIAEEPERDQFVMAMTENQLGVVPNSPIEEGLKRYVLAERRQCLHQPVFASRVMLAYENHCAVCKLAHRELLDAAHITPDAADEGIPIVSNGLALCKIHHAAYDRNILGIRPDYVVQIHQRLLDELDGPMLRHGLQDHHGRPLMVLPKRRADRPDPRRLRERFEIFAAA